MPSTADQKEKDDASRIARQRPVLRVCSELALVGVIKDGPDRSGAEWIMKTVGGLVRARGAFAFNILSLLTYSLAFQ